VVRHGPGYELWLGADGILRERFVGPQLQVEDDGFFTQVTALSGGQPLPIVVDMTHLRMVQRPILELPTKSLIKTFRCIAMVTPGPVSKVIAAFVIALPSQVPIRRFDTHAEAEEWAKGFLPSP
jgi:hypothetical protein